jgi:hypothetical protein
MINSTTLSNSSQYFQDKIARYHGEIQIILEKIYVFYKQLLESEISLGNRKEDTIRNALFHNRKRVQNETGVYIFFSLNDVISDADGTNSRAPDVHVNVLSRNYDRQSPIYYIECKNLEGGLSLNKKYLYYNEEARGLHRYLDDSKCIDGYYPVPTGVTAMLGFIVKSIDISQNVEKINELITKIPEIHNEELKNKQLLKQKLFVDGYNDTYMSQHQTINKKKDITIYHLFLDVADMLQPKQSNKKKSIKGA